MEEFIELVDLSISFIFYFCSFLLQYYSIKKCFWKGNRNRILLFLFVLFTCPFTTYLFSLFFVGIYVDLGIMNLIYYLTGYWITGRLAIFLTAFSSSTAITGVTFLYAWICRKWLGVKNRYPVLFLYLMFSALFSGSIRDAGNGSMFAVAGLRNLVNILGTMVMFIVLFSFYRFILKNFMALSTVNVDVNWKTFTIPPAIFVWIYGMLTFLIVDMDDDRIILALFSFSTVILFLFIWAFYVIMKNIYATNEAVQAKEEVKTLSVEVMEALAHTIDAKDEYTRGHSVRVAKYSRMLAEKMGLSAQDCENVYYMGLLHDIGKIGVPNAIINSPTKLTEDEYAIVKKHPGLGYEILAEIKSRPDLSIGAKWHHERYDGKGYPDGKAGDEIPLWARIIAVADSYDAMTSNRSYRGYLSQEKVRAEIERNSGTQFDPAVAACMLSIIDEDRDYVLREC